MRLILLAVLLAFAAAPAAAQPDAVEAAWQYVNDHRNRWQLQPDDLEDVVATDVVPNEDAGATHVYLRQRYDGIDVWTADVSVTVNRDGRVVHAAGHLFSNLEDRIAGSGTSPALTRYNAVQEAARALGLRGEPDAVLQKQAPAGVVAFGGGSLSAEPIHTRLVYYPDADGRLRLAWQLDIQPPDATDWWQLYVDASSGDVIERANWTVTDEFAPPEPGPAIPFADDAHATGKRASGGYRVFGLPVESPNHGSRRLIGMPADPVASPFGWHDTDGVEGAEHTVTRGNNAYAYEDVADADSPGYSPDGGTDLLFDFPIRAGAPLDSSRDAALTNLFYWSNIAHDVFYHYGFDELAGNFQLNNYGRGGEDGDYLRAEGLDGSGTNNANFFTPPDGRRPRVQMYRFLADPTLKVHAPDSVSGTYPVTTAEFGGDFDAPLRSDLAQASDPLACQPPTSDDALAGRIAVADRGQCTFVTKARHVQQAGAVALVVVNNIPEPPPMMADDGTGADIEIPLVMISLSDGRRLKKALSDVEASISRERPSRDSNFDSGVIVHEYGHGVSTRLTGGPDNSECLLADPERPGTIWEQPGEGWSDFFALVFTMQEDDTPSLRRSVGTYLMNQPVDGDGFRPAPYSVDMGVNPYTYEDLANPEISIPHGVGFIWATMLWDVTWNLIGVHGFGADVRAGTGGNNMAMRLVMNGLRMQPCEPGFVDARDAILAADTLLYDGANACAVWDGFARRGLGYGASQGTSESVDDGMASFSMPPELAGCSAATDAKPDEPAGGYGLDGPFPNPVSGSRLARIRLIVSDSSDVTVSAYDVLGRRVAILHEGPLRPDVVNILSIDASDLPSGVYIIRAVSSSLDSTRRLVVTR